jgi:plastocyanin
MLLAGGCGGDPPSDARASAVGRAGTAVLVGTAPRPSGRIPTVVLVRPADADEARAAGAPGGVDAGPAPAEMDQYGMAFDPRVLVVPPGTRVAFRNSEDVAHSVQVHSLARDSTLFNVGTVMGLPPYEHELEEEGGYAVSCDVHPGMAGFILVTSAPWSAVVAEDGTFTLEGIPPGTYSVSAWTADASGRTDLRVVLGAERTEVHLGGGDH